MTDQIQNFEELNCEEMEEVAGGLDPVSASIFAAFVGKALFGFLATAVTPALVQADLDSGPQDDHISSHPGFGNAGPSDRRLKQDIWEEGEIASLDLTVYSWEYKKFPGERFVGVMAQDLLARKDLSHAVFTFKEGACKGFYGVDYAALGLRCLPEEAFDGVASLLAQDVKPVSA